MLSVNDIMQTDVVRVTTDTTAPDLARLLVDEQISGAPVLDGKGELVGVVSATDLVRLVADVSGVHFAPSAPRSEDRTDDPDEDRPSDDPYGYFLTEDLPPQARRLLEELREDDFATVLVREIMTRVPFFVEPDTPLPELCEFLVCGRIHRALVVEEGLLLGIVTSVDVMRAVAEKRVLYRPTPRERNQEQFLSRS